MAAKHYAQDDLKRKAGVGLGGPKGGKPVGHLYISWGRDEADAQNLDRSEMLSSAHGALRAIGADKHPALVIAHNDTEHPHCHIVCCLIGDDGRLKKNWKEKEKLSRFALEREIAIHGEPVVKLRERNWKHRDAGEKTPSKKKLSRHLYELEKAAEQDAKVRAFAEEHKAKLVELTRWVDGHADRDGNVVQEGQKARHRRHQERLRWCYEERNRRIKADTKKNRAAQVRAIRQRYDQPWQQLLNQQEADRHAFRNNETTLLGRASNVLRYTDWKALFAKQHAAGERGPSVFSRAFNTLSDSGHRRQVLAKRQQEEQDLLREEQRKQEERVHDQLKAERAQQLAANQAAYARKSAAMKERQEATKQAVRLERQALTRERNAELRAYRVRIKTQKRERVQDQVARDNPETKPPMDLTTVANKAFGVPAHDEEQSGGEGDHGPNATPDKPKRTRKRKDPSERTNRRGSKEDKSSPPSDREQSSWQMESWEEQLASQFSERPGNEPEKDHER